MKTINIISIRAVFLTCVFVSLVGITCFAGDPGVSASAFSPITGTVGQPIEFTANIGNFGPPSITGATDSRRMAFTLDPGIGITLPSNPMDAISGPILTYFDIIYNTTSGLYEGIQKLGVALSAGTVPEIKLTGVINSISNVSVQINVQPDAVSNAAGEGKDNNQESTIMSTVLPVTLVSFNAVKEGSTANLNWATTAETNSDFFEVQHSLNAKNWSVLGSVKSHGESAVLRNYSYPHATPSNGTNYYRLRMVDKDQTYAYSTIRSTTFEGITESVVSVFPNPASDLLFVNNAEINKLKTLTIVTQDGKELITSSVSAAGVSIKNLQPGLYLVKLLSSDGALSTHKLVISK
jgi:hypothetical protein